MSNGIYGYSLQNQTAAGVYTPVSGDALTIGSAATYSAPYGVAAINRSTSTTVCVTVIVNGRTTTQCNTGTSTAIVPIVTLVNSGQLNNGGHSVTVGSQPTAVQAYRTAANTVTSGNTTITTTQPSLALVANSGSNTVSVVNLFGNSVVSTVSVGSQPTAIAIDSAQAYAYVVNMGSGTVSQINLSTNTVTGTSTVGSTPTSVAMDPGGAAFWVGGLNYISKVNISNLSVSQTYNVSGQVTSLAISAGQNDYVYTVMNGSNFQGEHAAISTGVSHTDYVLSVEPTRRTPSGGLPSWLNVGGPLVSASYGNRYIVEGTPNGFAVLDLQLNTVMMQGTTAAPIVGIAVDPQQGTAYATETNANTLLSIPLPPVQLD